MIKTLWVILFLLAGLVAIGWGLSHTLLLDVPQALVGLAANQAKILTGLKGYFTGLGLAVLLGAIAWIIVDRVSGKEETSTF